MQAYVMPVFIALSICFVLASFLTLPWAVYQYRKHGYFSFWRTLLILSFIFYGLSAFFLVIFPLPSARNNCASMDPGTIFTQYHPFQFIRDIQRESGFHWTAPSSYIHVLTTRAFYQMFFNVLLLFPLGVFLRYFFRGKAKWFHAALIGFGVSFFFEITQRTALFGFYECPYRIFDVDDLLTNTVGTVLGFILAPMFLVLIPSRETLSEQSHFFHNQRKATFGAQLMEVLLNIMIARVITGFIFGLLKSPGLLVDEIIFAIVFFVLMVVIPVIWKGNTVGSKIVRMRLLPEKGNWIGSLSRRYAIVYLPLLCSALSEIFSNHMGEDLLANLFAIGVVFLTGLLWFFIFSHIVIRWIKRDKVLYFNRYSHIEPVRITGEK
ncbi:teicoplanin resistance protein VanZ [Paenibacillus sp. LC231]|uniref:VanZ family protein n=1 Tax=Paenibacillus sp. LC231 TaxID=1120679 RepID=UPI0008DDC1F8|nr:VanZ family protein [Paenibacillus sp. LC231]OIB02345.1 teicoplanin resistance protein VanZ [Paenibacillus sp. LC231]